MTKRLLQKSDIKNAQKKTQHLLETKEEALLNKSVSLKTTGSTPVLEILTTLSDITPFDLVISPHIKQNIMQRGIALNLRNKPLRCALKNVCELASLRCEFKDCVLYASSNTPFLKIYHVPHLTGSRSLENTMSVTTDMSSHHARGATGHSKTAIASASSTNFSDELEKNLKTFLSLSYKEVRTKRHKRDHENPPSTPTINYTLHKQAGLLSVFAYQNQHRLIEDYLRQIKQSIQTQVLIEAKIVEVLLKEEFEAGINWNFLSDKLIFKSAFGRPSAALRGGLFKLDIDQLSAALSLIESFGSINTIANPRITVLNNQSAAFKVAQNEVFFTLATEHVFTSQNKPHFETITSQVQTIPIGLVLTVQPSVDLETQDITLLIKPAISRVVETKEDPAVSIQSNNSVKSEIPVVQVREIDTIVKVKPGTVVMMGGLIEKVERTEEDGLPNLSQTWLGRLFGRRTKKTKRYELVIFLTAQLPDKKPNEASSSLL